MKGIFYSAIALLFLVPLITLSVTYLTSYSDNGIAATKAAGDKLSNYAASVSGDLPRALRIMGGRSIEQAVSRIDVSGEPLDNAELRLREILMNGTVYGNFTGQEFTFASWAGDIEQRGREYGFDADVTVESLEITQTDSYTLNFTASVLVNTSYSRMTLYHLYTVSVPVSVEGISDPLYLLKTNGLIKRPITRPNVTLSDFDQAVSGRFYLASTTGPSFLDRLEGRLSASPYGLESVVYLPEIQANGLAVKQSQSDIDYLYFDGAAHSGSAVSGSVYSWLRVDEASAAKYNLTLVP